MNRNTASIKRTKSPESERNFYELCLHRDWLIIDEKIIAAYLLEQVLIELHDTYTNPTDLTIRFAGRATTS